MTLGQDVLLVLVVTSGVLDVDRALSTANPRIGESRRARLVELVTIESHRRELDPMLVAAVGWHESGWRNLGVNRTADRCYLQVHCRTGGRREAVYLSGIECDDLMRPGPCIRRGVWELSWWRWYHQTRCDGDHWWVGHYKWGVRVKNDSYERRVRARYDQALRGE